MGSFLRLRSVHRAARATQDESRLHTPRGSCYNNYGGGSLVHGGASRSLSLPRDGHRLSARAAPSSRHQLTMHCCHGRTDHSKFNYHHPAAHGRRRAARARAAPTRTAAFACVRYVSIQLYSCKFETERGGKYRYVRVQRRAIGRGGARRDALPAACNLRAGALMPEYSRFWF